MAKPRKKVTNRWEWLDKRLTELEISPTNFGREIGWSDKGVFNLFSGWVKAIPSQFLPKAASILGITLESLTKFNGGLTENVEYLEIGDTASNNLNYIRDIDLLIMITDKVNLWLTENKQNFRLTDEDKRKLIKAIYLKVSKIDVLEERFCSINQFLEVSAFLKNVD